jgi:tRNA-uridine 2-sulfurtransferase
VLGRHRGHHRYTVGQRRGLGVAAPEALYVLATDAAANRVTVGPRAALATHAVAVRGARLHRAGAEVDAVKLRYRSRPVACRVVGDPPPGTHRRLDLELADAVDGAAPGQTACLLKGDVVVGYGTIATP